MNDNHEKLLPPKKRFKMISASSWQSSASAPQASASDPVPGAVLRSGTTGPKQAVSVVSEIRTEKKNISLPRWENKKPRSTGKVRAGSEVGELSSQAALTSESHMGEEISVGLCRTSIWMPMQEPQVRLQSSLTGTHEGERSDESHKMEGGGVERLPSGNMSDVTPPSSLKASPEPLETGKTAGDEFQGGSEDVQALHENDGKNVLADRYYNRGKKYYDQCDYKKAAEEFDRMMQHIPSGEKKSSPYFRDKGKCLFNTYRENGRPNTQEKYTEDDLERSLHYLNQAEKFIKYVDDDKRVLSKRISFSKMDCHLLLSNLEGRNARDAKTPEEKTRLYRKSVFHCTEAEVFCRKAKELKSGDKMFNSRLLSAADKSYTNLIKTLYEQKKMTEADTCGNEAVKFFGKLRLDENLKFIKGALKELDDELSKFKKTGSQMIPRLEVANAGASYSSRSQGSSRSGR